MKKTLWVLAIASMICCTDTKGPEQKIKINDNKAESVFIPEKKTDEIKQEISGVLSLDWQNSLSDELDSRQQRIKDIIPQIKEPIILWDLTQPNVAITIDDGYGKASIEYMLDLFEKNNIKATFFVIWECLRIHSDLWRKAAQQWHEICNHTQTHSRYFKTWNEPERFERELLWREKTVKDVLWEDYFVKMKKNYPFFRFPGMYWIREKAYLDILKKHGYIPIWRRYTENPKNGTINNGDIFLRHFKDQDTSNVKKSIELILQNWKHAKTVSDIITSEGYEEPIWWPNVYKKKKWK